MILIVLWLVIGFIVGAALTSFRSGAGTNYSFPLSVVAGIVGSVIGAYVGAMLSVSLLGMGPEFIMSLLGSVVVAAIAVLIAHAIKK